MERSASDETRELGCNFTTAGREPGVRLFPHPRRNGVRHPYRGCNRRSGIHRIHSGGAAIHAPIARHPKLLHDPRMVSIDRWGGSGFCYSVLAGGLREGMRRGAE